MLRLDRIGLFEQLTLGMLFLWSLVPTRFYGEFTLFGVVANFGDFSIVIAFVLLCVLLPFHATDRYANLVFLLFSMIAIWAFVTIPHEQTGEIGWRYVAYSLVISYLAMTVGYAMALSAAETEPFLTRLAGLFTFIFVVYAAESLLGLGLRSAEGTSITELLGIGRVRHHRDVNDSGHRHPFQQPDQQETVPLLPLGSDACNRRLRHPVRFESKSARNAPVRRPDPHTAWLRANDLGGPCIQPRHCRHSPASHVLRPLCQLRGSGQGGDDRDKLPHVNR
jgi:hypothetical protein